MMKKITSLKDIIDFKKVMSLSKVLCKEYFEKLPIFNSENSKQSKLFRGMGIIAVFALGYLTYNIIDFLQKTGQPQIFINIYLLIASIIIIYQQILASTNVYYFSKDLEDILPFPIKPIELLISRFNMLVSISYVSILMFIFIPLLLYGMMVARTFIYYLCMLIVLVIFPIFFALIISIIMLFVMQLSKIIKNKEIFQLLVTMIIIGIFTMFEGYAFKTVLSNAEEIEQIQQGQEINLIQTINEKVTDINKYLITINSSVKILTENNILNNLIQIIKIIFINIITFILFILVGKKLYLKNILINIEKININKIKKKKENYKYKKNNKKNAYIKKEFKDLIKTPTFFMQCVIPSILTVVALALIIISVYPSFLAIMEDEKIAAEMPEFKFDISLFTTIIVIIQIAYTTSNLSITAISRKGKNAFFIKYIPISLYKQFIYMNIPQIILNAFISLIILGAAKYLMSEIQIIYLIIIFIIGLILNIINSFLMLVVDLCRPNLEWDNETDAIKQNKNKLFQYMLSIIICLILIYFKQVFEGFKINLNLFIIFILIFLLFILCLINNIIKNKINKLFNKIN